MLYVVCVQDNESYAMKAARPANSERQTERQKDRQTGRQTDRQTDRHGAHI